MKAYDKIPEWNELVFREPTAEEKEKFVVHKLDQWIDNLPSFGEDVLVTDGSDVWVDCFYMDGGICVTDAYTEIDDVIAWLPLPEPYER